MHEDTVRKIFEHDPRFRDFLREEIKSKGLRAVVREVQKVIDFLDEEEIKEALLLYLKQ